MELPLTLRNAIEEKAQQYSLKQLNITAQTISERYRTASGQGKCLVATEMEVLTYALMRMPATFAACSTAMESVRTLIPKMRIESVLDVGAGTGAGTWAAAEVFEPSSIVCLEKENGMRQVGQSLMQLSSDSVVRSSQWHAFDLTADELSTQSDLVITSYVLNELDSENRLAAIRKLWNAANKLLIIVEIGTPVGFRQLQRAREELMRLGAHPLAPCPHENRCPLPEDDWCHFTCRVARSRIHKAVKGGEVPYEDEKFCYLAVSREPFMRAQNRVLRHPIIEPGKISVRLCEADDIRTVSYRKKDGELFKKAKKIRCGDELI